MLWSLALVPVLGAAAVALLGARGAAGRPGVGGLAALVLALTAGLAAAATVAGGPGDIGSGDIVWSRSLRLTAALTPLSAVVAVLVPAIALPVVVYAAGHEARRGLTRLIALLLAFVGGMELLVVADDLLTLLIGWELVGACSWALIAHEWHEIRAPRAALYAFVTTRLGDLGLFVAAMAAYAGTGSFAFAGLAGLDPGLLRIAAFGVLLSAAAKSGQVPFSPWLFRAMAGPTSVSALLHAATMVAAGAYLLARLQPAIAAADGFAAAAIAVGLVTAVAGGVVALLQGHAKKLLAASTSAHYGLMFVAVGAGYPAVAVLHLVAHAAMKALLFLAAGTAGARAGSYDLDRMGCGRALPALAALTAVGTLALAGVPPLGAAWTKEAIVAAAGHRGAWLAAGCILAGGLSAAYAMRFQLRAFGGGAPREGGAPGRAETVAVGALAAGALLLSLLWLPGARDAGARLLGAELPRAGPAELAASLLLVALGLLVGAAVARRYRPVSAGPLAECGDWLGLPWLIERLVTRPFAAAAATAAVLDDRAVDAVPRAAARAAARAAHAGRRFGERLADALPEGSARLVGLGGGDARRLQTGMTHHYYAAVAVGTAATAAALIAGMIVGS